MSINQKIIAPILYEYISKARTVIAKSSTTVKNIINNNNNITATTRTKNWTAYISLYMKIYTIYPPHQLETKLQVIIVQRETTSTSPPPQPPTATIPTTHPKPSTYTWKHTHTHTTKDAHTTILYTKTRLPSITRKPRITHTQFFSRFICICMCWIDSDILDSFALCMQWIFYNQNEHTNTQSSFAYTYDSLEYLIPNITILMISEGLMQQQQQQPQPHPTQIPQTTSFVPYSSAFRFSVDSQTVS